MASELGILVKPPSSKAAIEAVEKLRCLRPQALLLNLPENINDLILELASGESFQEFVKEAERKLPKPASAWLKEYEPILKEIPSFGGTLDVICYIDPASFKKSAEKSIELAILAAKSIITGRIEVDKWLKILKSEVEAYEKTIEKEADKIADLSKNYERPICISDFTAKQIKEKLKERGIDPWIQYLGQPYHFTPLEILKRTMMKREVSKEEAEALIREHLRFIQEYIYRKPFPKAVDEWSREKLYWIPKE